MTDLLKLIQAIREPMQHEKIPSCIELKEKYGPYVFHDLISQWDITDVGDNFRKLLLLFRNNFSSFGFGVNGDAANELNDKGETPFTIWIRRCLDYLYYEDDGSRNYLMRAFTFQRSTYSILSRGLSEWFIILNAKLNVQNPNNGNTVFHDLIDEFERVGYISPSEQDNLDKVNRLLENATDRYDILADLERIGYNLPSGNERFAKIIALLRDTTYKYNSFILIPNYKGETVLQWIIKNTNAEEYPEIWDRLVEFFV